MAESSSLVFELVESGSTWAIQNQLDLEVVAFPSLRAALELIYRTAKDSELTCIVRILQEDGALESQFQAIF
ncbi:MAG: hypothetical protein ACR2L2_18640 [Acidobacteriota bacterium]